MENNKFIVFLKKHFVISLLGILFLWIFDLVLYLNAPQNNYLIGGFLCFFLSFVHFINSRRGAGVFSRVTFWSSFGKENPEENYKSYCFKITVISLVCGLFCLLAGTVTLIIELL